MAWNDCTYITQSNSNEATQINYQSAYARCVGEINMSGSIYVTEESQHKLYINSGSQSGSLIYTSENHDLDSEEVGVSSTGNIFSLGSFALSIGCQMLIPLLAICYFPWFTKHGVALGLGVGAAIVRKLFSNLRKKYPLKTE